MPLAAPFALMPDDRATLMAADGKCIQTAMQIDQRLRNELLFRHVHSKVSSPLVSDIFGLLDFFSWARSVSRAS
jgi:hypothetical protein